MENMADHTVTDGCGYSRTPEIPKDHPCYNCSVIQIMGGKPYCFSPKCVKAVMDKSLRN